MIVDGIRLCVDFMFMDQNSRDLRKELDALPHILESASVHCVLEGPAAEVLTGLSESGGRKPPNLRE